MARQASAMIVRVGFLSALEQNGAAVGEEEILHVPGLAPLVQSPILRVGAHDRAADFVDDVAAGLDRLARRRLQASPRTLPPIASMISANVFCMCAAWRVSWSDHFQWKRSTGMPHLSFTVGIELAVGVFVGDHLAAAGEADERAVVAARVLLELLAVAAARQVARGRPSTPMPGMCRPPPNSM